MALSRYGFKRCVGICTGMLVSVSMAFVAPSVWGITIVPQYVEEQTPAFDPTGSGLMAIANVAADIWESYFPASSDTYEIDFSWSDLGDSTLGRWNFQFGGDNNIRIDTQLPSGALRNWYFDPTPLVNEEYNVAQTLFSQNTSGFTGSPPAVLEVGFQGALVTTMPPPAAVNAFDLLSTVIHEIGHELGINNADPLEGDWEMDPNHLGGAIAAVQGGSGGHIAPTQVLMCGGCGGIQTRRLPTATDIIVVAEDQGFDTIDLPRRDFIGGNDYNAPLNWIGGAVPDNDTQAFIRTTPAATVSMSGNNTTGSLTLDNGATLSTLANLLAATGAVTVQPGATLNVGSGGGVAGNALNLNTTTMSVAPGGFAEGDVVALNNANVILSSASLLYDTLTIDAVSTVSGTGSLGQISPSPTSLVNQGTIRPSGGQLTINGNPNVATLDLDGTMAAGSINAMAGSLIVKGRTLGQFGGTIGVGPNQTVEFQDGWTLAATGNLDLNGLSGAAATLAGGTFSGSRHAALIGDVDVRGDAIISADVHWFDSADVNIPTASDVLDVTGFAQYQAAAIAGAGGTLRQSGDALVTSTLTQGTTSITTRVFDMDGAAESASDIEIQSLARLHVFSSQIEMGDPGTDGYDGNLNIRGSLQVDTSAEWRLDGAMHLAAGANVAGSQIRLHGAIDTSFGADGEAVVNAPLNLQSPYVLNTTSPGDTLVLAGATRVGGGGTVSGLGDLRQVGDLMVDAFFTVPAGIDYDWDGDESSPSNTTVNSPNFLTLNADSLDTGSVTNDGHDGTITLNAATLAVNTPAPWRLDGTLRMTGLLPTLSGSASMHLYGTVSTAGSGVVDAPVVMFPGSSLMVDGVNNLVQQSIEFAGGNVTGASPTAALKQRADATVTGSSQINITTYDWDGFEAAPSDTTVVVGGILTLNVETIDPDDNAYDGHLTVDGGSVIVNLPGADAWQLDGRIDVGNEQVSLGNVGGAPIVSRGTIAANGLGRIDADLEVTDEGVLRVDNPNDMLILSGHTTYRALAAFVGTGALVQAGDAMVTGPTDPDGVNVGIYNMDGLETSPSNMTIDFSAGTFGPDDAFVINASQIESGDPSADGFDGTLSLTRYVLEINTAGPWRLDGTLQLISVGGNLPRVKGSPIEVHGTIDPVGQGRMQADVTFRSTALVDIQAGEVLHFDNPVTYEGGIYTGLGTFQHHADISVMGDTTVDVAVFDMDGAAEGNGVKVQAGHLVLNVTRLDVADNVFDGVLVVDDNLLVNTPTPWTANGELRIGPAGAIAGAALVANGPILGAGLVKPEGLTNNGGIFASGGTLILAPGSQLDLDGALDASTLEAIDGDLVVNHNNAAFRGTANVGAGRRMTFNGGWTAGGKLNLNGDATFADRAIVDGGQARFTNAHTTNITGHAEIGSPAEFQSGTTVRLPVGGDVLYLSGDAQLAAGAVFIGKGLLVNQPGSVLTAENLASIGVAFQNQGQFEPGGSIGRVTVEMFHQTDSGATQIEIAGRTGEDYDQLRVASTARLAGDLLVELADAFEPDPRDLFTILTAEELNGTFDNAADGRRLTTLGGEGSFLVKYDLEGHAVLLSDFMLSAIFGCDLNSDEAVDAADAAILFAGWGRAGVSDINKDGITDAADASICFTQWTGDSVHAVPEPYALVLLWMCASILKLRRRLTKSL